MGKLVGKDYTRIDRHSIAPFSRSRGYDYIPSSEAFFFGVPWTHTVTIVRYLIENLQPPLLSMASFFAANSFEASAGHRALFILPNSFIAMKGRDVKQNDMTKVMSSLLLILPSIILSLSLACRVAAHSTAVGLSENAKICWFLATALFGLSAYITYRLTRPKETLVTCANCGKLRRPDMHNCHRCGSKWLMPELTAPNWRIID